MRKTATADTTRAAADSHRISFISQRVSWKNTEHFTHLNVPDHQGRPNKKEGGKRNENVNNQLES